VRVFLNSCVNEFFPKQNVKVPRFHCVAIQVRVGLNKADFEDRISVTQNETPGEASPEDVQREYNHSVTKWI